MTEPASRRLLGLAGVGFALTGAATFLIAPIAMPERAADVAAHVSENRGELIVASIVVVAGSALTAAWYVALAAFVGRDAPGRVLGGIGVVGMAIQIAALSVGFTVFAAVAYREPGPEDAQLMTDVGWLLVSLAGGPVTTVAILAFAIGLKRLLIGGAWLLPFSIAAATAHLVVAASFARDGFFSPTGGIEIAVPLVYEAWIGAVGLAIVRAR